MEGEFKPVKKRPVALIAIIAIVSVGLLAALTYFQIKNPVTDYNYTLYLVAKGQNLAMPSEVAEGVRVDSVAARYDKQYWTFVTMTNTTIEDTDVEEFCERSEENVIDNLASNDDMLDFAKNNVVIFYEIRDKNGNLMCSMKLLPEKYYKKPLP